LDVLRLLHALGWDKMAADAADRSQHCASSWVPLSWLPPVQLWCNASQL